MTQIRRVPLRKRDLDELNRSVNILSFQTHKDVESIENVLQLLYSISIEEGILKGSTTFTGNQLVNYTDSWQPTPAEGFTANIALDATAGTITVGVDGIYRVEGYVVQDTGVNNTEYAFQIRVNDTDSLPLGATVWTQQAAAQVYYAAATAALVAGDVITMHSYVNVPTIIMSSLQVTLETLDAFS